MRAVPSRCPNPTCSCYQPPPDTGPPAFLGKGSFRRRDHLVVPRWQCRACGRHFSDQTFRRTWRRRRNDIDEPLRRLLRDGASVRAAARLLGVNRKTVERRARDPRWRAPQAPP